MRFFFLFPFFLLPPNFASVNATASPIRALDAGLNKVRLGEQRTDMFCPGTLELNYQNQKQVPPFKQGPRPLKKISYTRPSTM